MNYSAFLAGILMMTPPAARHAAPAARVAKARTPTELQALDLERQLNETSAQVAEMRDQLVLETAAQAGIAATFAAYASDSPDVALFSTRSAPLKPGSPQEAAARDAAMKPWIEQRQAMAALEMKAALLAEELQRYKETGTLSPTPAATVRQFKLLIENPWSLPPSTPEVSFDLMALQRQRALDQNVARRPAAAKPGRTSSPRAQADPSPTRRMPSTAKIVDSTMFERDAGTGKSENDPVPDLIVLLSSSEPRGRALAADELGSLGAAASPAAAPLRRALSDPDRRVRASAAQALGAFGNADAAADLRRVLRDPDEEVRLNARGALQKLGFDSKYP